MALRTGRDARSTRYRGSSDAMDGDRASDEHGLSATSGPVAKSLLFTGSTYVEGNGSRMTRPGQGRQAWIAETPASSGPPGTTPGAGKWGGVYQLSSLACLSS